MSYDLQVYGKQIGLDQLRECVETAGLSYDAADAQAGSLTVVRGKQRRYCFTVGLPVRVEPEDVPEDISAAILGPTHMVEVMVEGSADSEIPHAIRAARRMGSAMDGAVFDPQTDEVFSRGRSRLATPVQRGLVSIVEVHWYVRSRDENPADAARAFVAAAKRHLPEALPRRYGTFEPPQERWDNGGADAFVAYVAGESFTVHTKGSNPVVSSSIGHPGRSEAVVHAHSLSVLAAPLHDERWSAALERMFVEFARTVDAVYACAELVRGIEWSGRTLWFGRDAEQTTYLAGRGQWHGLTPYPVWLAWFGREYAPLVREHLLPESFTNVGDAVFRRGSNAPVSREELLASLPLPAAATAEQRRRWFGLRTWAKRNEPAPTWLPPDFLAIPVDRGPHAHVPPEPAPFIPESLRRQPGLPPVPTGDTRHT